jgi:hypothetical protein
MLLRFSGEKTLQQSEFPKLKITLRIMPVGIENLTESLYDARWL